MKRMRRINKMNKSRDHSRLLFSFIYYRHFVPIYSAAIFKGSTRSTAAGDLQGNPI